MRMQNKTRTLLLILSASAVLSASVSKNNMTPAQKSKTLQKSQETGKEAISVNNSQKPESQNTERGMPVKKTIAESDVINRTESGYDLNFDISRYTEKTSEVNGKTVRYRAYENIVYVKNPVDIQYQTINIYIPEEYFSNGTVGKYNTKTAPIFFPNSVGGYMPGAAGIPGTGRDGKPDASTVALSKGYIVAAPGARGRTLKDENGKYTGKAPAAIVDLKAAVRYLKYNDKKMPGRADRIISNGTSAGGALSALLGATGNSKDYEKYLKELGAAEGKDDIYAVSAYCPITDLDNANSAYEWMFNGITEYQKMEISMLDYNVQRKTVNMKMTDDEIKRSDALKVFFPPYLNSLKLKGKDGKILNLDKEGNGSFKELIKQYYINSANIALSKGSDLSSFSFLTIKDGKVTDMNYGEYIKYIGRIKTAGAFDNVDLSTGEDNLFGDSLTDSRHFTKYIYDHTTVNGQMADSQIIKMMNPHNYLGKKDSITSKYWRIRHGASDRDTSLAIPAILALRLENLNKNVDFAVPWGQGHGGDYDLDDLFEWIDSVVR